MSAGGTTPVQELVEHALSVSNADACVVIGSQTSETNLRWANNNLTTNGQMRSRSLTVVATFDGPEGTRAGVVTRAVDGLDDAAELTRVAERIGRDSSPVDDAAPIVANYPNDDDWQAPPLATDVSVFDRLAPALGAQFAAWRGSEHALFGFAEHQMTSTYLGTSTGLRRRFDQPDGRIEINGKSAGYTRSAYVSQHTVDFADVDAAALTTELEQRLDWAADRIELPPGRYHTILPPSTVADLFVYAYWMASARDADEGRSVYSAGDGSTKVGQRLSALPLNLYSDPVYPGLQCAPFQIVPQSGMGIFSVFDNGHPTGRTDWISGGTLRNLINTRGWAGRSGVEPTPPIDNLILDGGSSASVADLVAGTERGLLLTTLWYIREVDPQTLLLTGLTRDGVYLVEDGKVSGAVNNFRFNESPIDLLARTTEVGRTEPAMSREWNDYFRRTAMPALRVADFNMSTVSKAL